MKLLFLSTVFCGVLVALGCQILSPHIENKAHKKIKTTNPHYQNKSALLQSENKPIYETKQNVHFGCKVFVPDIPASELRSPASRRKADPNKIHVIDIAFLHEPLEKIQDPIDLKEHITQLVEYTNTAFENSAVNAKLRIVAINPLITEAIPATIHGVAKFLPEMRKTYGADLLYAVVNPVTPNTPCGGNAR